MTRSGSSFVDPFFAPALQKLEKEAVTNSGPTLPEFPPAMFAAFHYCSFLFPLFPVPYSVRGCDHDSFHFLMAI